MFKIQTLDNISDKGLSLFDKDLFELKAGKIDGGKIDTTALKASAPDALIVRSRNLLELDMPDSVKVIARAGAGVNNIPVEKCSEKGIVVFNTPGANANGVKELVLTALFLSSRRISQGIEWVQSLKNEGDAVAGLVEKGKSKFEGPEIKGKKLGVIGLGAIGAMVANDAVALGMEVSGYDPFISVDTAWNLSREVSKETSLERLLSTSDYITIHVPMDAKTKGMINKEKFNVMKRGIRIINLARAAIVSNKDLLEAIDQGIVACYVTDFPEAELLGNDKIIPVPHLGASTPESEENCAVMAVNQTSDYLIYGNIRNSVNFPDCTLPMSGKTRITITNVNVPNMVGQFTTILAENKINISDLVNHHKNGIGYNIIDIEGDLTSVVIEKIKKIDGVINVRVIGQ